MSRFFNTHRLALIGEFFEVLLDLFKTGTEIDLFLLALDFELVELRYLFEGRLNAGID